MKATVVGPSASARSIPTARQDAKALKKQYAKDLKVAKGLDGHRRRRRAPSTSAPRAKTAWRSSRCSRRTVTVPVGTTLKFQMSKGTYETHTATFGPGPAETPSTYLGKLAASFQSPAPGSRSRSTRATMPPAPATLTPALHGNGFWSSGTLRPRQGLADPGRERR